MGNTNKDEQTYNKWKSRRWIITVWAMFMVTALVAVSVITGSDQWGVLATTLVAVPVTYTGLETINKKKPEPPREGTVR